MFDLAEDRRGRRLALARQLHEAQVEFVFRGVGHRFDRVASRGPGLDERALE